MKKKLSSFPLLWLICLGLCLPSCRSSEESSPHSLPSSVSSSQEAERLEYIRLEGGKATMANASFSAEIDLTNGFLDIIRNKEGVPLKKKGVGSWPLSLFCDDERVSDFSLKSKNRVTSYCLEKDESLETLHLHYDELVDEEGRGLSIAYDARFSVGEESHLVFSFALSLSEGAPRIDKVVCFGDGLAACDEEGWELTAPTWNGGQRWANPTENVYFRKGVTLSYPGPGQDSLEAGWLDLSSPHGGIGIGIINRKGMTNEFAIQSDGEQMSLANVLFEFSHILGEDDDLFLLPGESFSSDDYILSIHEGDWHKTADDYRRHYEKAFADDFLNEATLSPKAKKGRYVYRAIAGWNTGTIEEHSLAAKSFADMEEELRNPTKDSVLSPDNGADLESMLFWLTGQNTQGYAFDVPMMTPIIPESGGEAGLKSLTDFIHSQGASIYQYEHPFAVDPIRMEQESSGLLEKVDPGQHTEHWDACTHHSVCIDNSFMQVFWTRNVLPPLVQTSPDGLMLDQCPLVQTACGMDGHNHGHSAESRLSSHAKGLVALQREIRRQVGDGAFLVSEGANDILTRFVDVHQQCWHGNALWDGDLV
ncbi:MAG: hypothetical protein J6038_04285, partial [Bacilli bacterium]|nr:hypothetical protein [Bacilli bacterium]